MVTAQTRRVISDLRRQTALLVLLARTAWAGIVAAYLGAGANVRSDVPGVVMVSVIVVMMVMTAGAAIIMGMVVAVIVGRLRRVSAHVRHTFRQVNRYYIGECGRYSCTLLVAPHEILQSRRLCRNRSS